MVEAAIEQRRKFTEAKRDHQVTLLLHCVLC
jgi:hypothetical protein